MCGRFTQAYTWAQIVALYRLTQPALNLQPHDNIAPTTTIEAVIPHGNGRELARVRWASSWHGGRRRLRKRRRPSTRAPRRSPAGRSSAMPSSAAAASSWPADTSNGSRPRAASSRTYITAADGGVLSFAGLWDEWKDIETGAAVRSATIIVTDANTLTRAIHDRMPVIFDLASLLARFGPPSAARSGRWAACLR